MTTYAIAETVPPEIGYLTAGKRYKVTSDDGYRDSPRGLGFSIQDDEQEVIFCLEHGCGHLNRGNWTLVEEED